MSDMRRWLVGAVVIIVVGAAATKLWRDAAPPEVLAAAPHNSVLLFKGDYDAHCQAIYALVDEAEAQYSERITVMQFEESPVHPWIEQYDVRFLPTVIFIGADGREVERIEGEGSAVEVSLKAALSRFEPGGAG